MAAMEPESIDAICTDPPYHLSFMGVEWDHAADGAMSYKSHLAWARVAWRVLKPGGWLIAFGGTRTYHRLASAIEDAGFEIRDSLHWVYGSGFPKSLDVSKAIDAHFGAERTEVLGPKPGHEDFVERTDPSSAGGRRLGWERPWRDDPEAVARSHMRMAPATPQAAEWVGWGTALKPAHEPVVLARKPLVGTVAANVLAHGTGALHIDANRLAYLDADDMAMATPQGRATSKEPSAIGAEPDAGRELERVEFEAPELTGRWPTNLLLSHDPGCEVRAGGAAHHRDGQPLPGRAHRHHGGALGAVGTRRVLRDRERRRVPLRQRLPGRCTGRSGGRESVGHAGDHAARGEPLSDVRGRITAARHADDGLRRLRGASRFFPVLEWDPDYDAVLFYSTKAAGSERSAGLDKLVLVSLSWESADRPVQLLVDTALSHPRVIAASGTDSSIATEWNTMLFGSPNTAQYRRVSTFITGTRTSWTTASGISNLLIRSLTNDFTLDANSEMGSGGSPAERAENSNECRRTITLAKTASLPSAGRVQSGERLQISVVVGKSHHPSVKPVALMRWLLRLVTPPGGTVVDPFLGSGSTAVAALLEDIEIIGIDNRDDYLELARARVEHAERTIAIHGRHRAPQEMFKPTPAEADVADGFDLFG